MKNVFAKKLSFLRKDRGYTQAEFAEVTGVQRNTVACYETGRRECDFDTLLSFAKVLKCSTDELLLDTENETLKISALCSHQKVGSIYILTNPSFPDYVKIGYADDVESRLQQLNNTECTPYAFRVYATYDVESRLSDIKIHSIIDKLNPNLRSIDNCNGKKRVREFYAMSAEDAYLLLEAIAEIHNCTGRLQRWELSKEDITAERLAQEISTDSQARGSNFKFDHSKIPIGATLVHVDDKNITCIVADDRRIEYNGETMYITPFVKMISGKDYITKGPKYLVEHFTYNGVLLEKIVD